MGLGDLGYVRVGVGVVDLIEGEDRWEFGGYEGRDQGSELRGVPRFQGVFVKITGGQGGVDVR